MSGREQERRRRRGEPAGGVPTRRGTTDRARRSAPGPAESDAPDRHDPADAGAEQRVRGRARSSTRQARGKRVAVASRVLGRLSTRRAALLALVVCALALSVAVPLHTYLSQRADLAAQLRQQDALRTQHAQLAQREAQLSDPAQVEAEARTRLHYVLPGETPYVVQLPGGVPATGPGPAGTSSGPAASWYDTLWNSITGAR